jgi:hypothetical protein
MRPGGQPTFSNISSFNNDELWIYLKNIKKAIKFTIPAILKFYF